MDSVRLAIRCFWSADLDSHFGGTLPSAINLAWHSPLCGMWQCGHTLVGGLPPLRRMLVMNTSTSDALHMRACTSGPLTDCRLMKT